MDRAWHTFIAFSLLFWYTQVKEIEEYRQLETKAAKIKSDLLVFKLYVNEV